MIMMGHECIWGTELYVRAVRGGRERKGFQGVKMMEAHYTYAYEDSIRNPPNTV
jgi:hypothetical protein